MLSFDMNWLAVVAAVVASQALGFLWYSNTMFAKLWTKAIGKTQKQLRAQAKPTDYVYTVVGSLVMVIILANVLGWAQVGDMMGSLTVAFLLWLGFVAPGSLMNSVFEGRPMNLFYINAGYHLVNMLVAAAILSIL
jgi:hypothetical protein